MSFTIKDNSDQFFREFEKAIEAGLEEIGQKAAAHAKQELENDPRRIDTGNLQRSITHQLEADGNAVDIGVKDGDADYAVFVHEGTSKMAPNRFLTNAVTNNAGEYQKIMEDHLKNS